MITNRGKIQIKRFLSLQESMIGGSVAFGLGVGTESVDDTYLNFEVDRSNINLVSYDFVLNKLIFKGSIPETYAGTIYELGLFNKSGGGPTNSKLITSFASTTTETWLTGSSPATFVTTNARIGSDSLSHTPITSTSTTSSMSNVSMDLSLNLSSDIFSVAYFNTNSNASSLKIRFKSDASNYYETTISTPTVGYHVDTFTKGGMSVTGSPSWSGIRIVEIVTTSKATGASDVQWDGIRIDDSTYGNSDFVLVSREVLSTPYVKEPGKVQEIEFSLDVSV